ncbi:hypothetical protein AMS68_007756 [Peltaster fructicola]|uniref:beta-glucosidase n=1 Tax=Peltaster fructicola TaxID=286661 RepID=A0A6H0Y5Y3_9PEZI|nr:hypothetical protein AMS68_007756 [Peltaster fructicola]
MVHSTALALALGLAGVNAISWSEARTQAEALVAQMSNTEKQNITYGFPSNCVGQTGSVDRLKIPGFCLADAENGVRQTDFVNAYPAGISVAASWNKDLAYWRGKYMGAEFKRKGNHAALGPVVGPIGRMAKDGRAFEGFGSDPFLAGKLAAHTIEGLQENVMAVVKHLIYNEQETMRQEHGATPAISANVDDTTAHELYLWPFVDAVRADVAAVMSSYNRINGTYASQNNKTLNGLLKGELAFPGFVVTDWNSQHSGSESAVNGLDMAMPNSKGYWQDALPAFVAAGNLTQERFDDMVTRTLTAWFKVIGGPDADFPEAGVGMFADLLQPHALVDARDPESKDTILQGAIEGHVLVKNTNNALPLNQPKLLSLFGFDATIPKKYYPSTPLGLDYIFTQGFESAGLNLTQLLQLAGSGNATAAPQVADGGILWNGGGSGANHPSALSETYGAIQQRARRDDTYLYWNFLDPTVEVHPLSSACLVFINELTSEMFDRVTLAPSIADAYVLNVASQCNNTIVVTHNPAIRTVDAWIENPNITAVVYAHFPGNDAGESLAQVLYGESSPSGRLPYTVAKNDTDYGSLENPCLEGDLTTDAYCNFTEGIYTDYRYFLKNSITPRFAFGYGLTYSTFSYSNFTASWIDGADLSTSPPDPEDMTPGGIESLFDEVAMAHITVTNTGNVYTAEVPQLYVHFPGEAQQVHFLRGFDKVWLEPGESWEACFELTRRDLSRWNVVSQSWELAQGEVELRVGPNAGEIKFTNTLQR